MWGPGQEVSGYSRRPALLLFPLMNGSFPQRKDPLLSEQIHRIQPSSFQFASALEQRLGIIIPTCKADVITVSDDASPPTDPGLSVLHSVGGMPLMGVVV
ncbi:UNVERIFIED_CONTAM: hypothetical protein K2H54_036544 [Gekko kuhli]